MKFGFIDRLRPYHMIRSYIITYRHSNPPRPQNSMVSYGLLTDKEATANASLYTLPLKNE